MWACSFFYALSHGKTWAHKIVSMSIRERLRMPQVQKSDQLPNKRSKSTKILYDNSQLRADTRSRIIIRVAQLTPNTALHCARKISAETHFCIRVRFCVPIGPISA